MTALTQTELLPLQPGDRLARAEFERRYTAMPIRIKAELIEGVVYMPSSVREGQHGEPHENLLTWLGVYKSATPGTHHGDNSTLRLDLDNEPQPDAYLRTDEARGGRTLRDEDGYVVGGPELIAEVAASSASYDLHDKKNVYRRNGVQEYIVWRVLDRQIDWFVLREGAYEELEPDSAGIHHSEVYPGLWLDSRALVAGDLAHVLVILQQGLASPEHAQFVVSFR